MEVCENNKALVHTTEPDSSKIEHHGNNIRRDLDRLDGDSSKTQAGVIYNTEYMTDVNIVADEKNIKSSICKISKSNAKSVGLEPIEDILTHEW